MLLRFDSSSWPWPAGWAVSEREAVAYLIEENRLLRRQLGGRRLRLTDDDRRRLAAAGVPVGRAALREIATIATPDTLAAVASPVDRAEMDVRQEIRTARRPARDPSARRADGDGESDVGLHADPGRARRTSAIAWAARPFAGS